MATVAVGDIHGNFAALDDLLTKLEPELRAEDELVFLGDYLDDGPAVRECVDRIVNLRQSGPCPVVPLKGNHEQWMLRSRDDHTRHSWLLSMGGLRTVASYSTEAAEAIGREVEEAGPAIVLDTVDINYDQFFDVLPAAHLEFFLTLQVFHHSPDVLCVHGGYPGGGKPADEDAETLIWGPPGFPDSYADDQVVVYGHHGDAVLDDEGWPRPRVTNDRAFGIDTIEHGVLTAMRFPDRVIFQSARLLIES